MSHTATRCNTLQHLDESRDMLATSCLSIIYNQKSATRYNTLQHATTQCNTLQHTATRRSTLQHNAAHCNTLQHTAAHCNTLQHTATHRNTLQHTTAYPNTLQHTQTSEINSALYCILKHREFKMPCILSKIPYIVSKNELYHIKNTLH